MPELGRNEEFFALDDSLFDSVCDSLANLNLVVVKRCGIEVAIADFRDGCLNWLDFFDLVSAKA